MTSREQVMEWCAARPASELCYPFSERTAVFKVGGRMFALVDVAGDPGSVSVKVEPGYGAALARRHRQVVPGYHLDKRHWISVDLADDAEQPLPADLVEELVEDSYDLVVARLPRRLRPGGHPVPEERSAH